MKQMAMTLAIVAMVTAGCGSKCLMAPTDGALAHSGLINDPKMVSALEKSLTDKDISKLLDANVQAKLPSAVAIAKVAGSYRGCGLETISAEELAAWQATVKDIPHITGVQPVTGLAGGLNEATDMHSLRVAAARLNCELLLVYVQSDASVDNMNNAAVLYWTIVGLWTVPGNVMEYRSVMQAVLIDCRTGMVLGTATGDSHLKKEYPAAFHDQRHAELSTDAPRNALADLQKGFATLLKQVVAQAIKSAQKT